MSLLMGVPVQIQRLVETRIKIHEEGGRGWWSDIH